MKTIRLTSQQRTDISERRRGAPDRRVHPRLSAVVLAGGGRSPGRRISQRLSGVLGSDDGRSREEIAELLGVSTRQVGQWLRIVRNTGLEQLCTLHYQGDPGRLGPAQVERIKQEIATGVFHNAEQVRTWVQGNLGVAYST